MLIFKAYPDSKTNLALQDITKQNQEPAPKKSKLVKKNPI